MKSLDGLEAEGLHWVQVDGSMFTFNWELRNAAEEKIASIRQKSTWSYELELDAVGNRWQFESKGILGLRTEIRSVGTGDLAATYFSASGKLELADGTFYHWKSTHIWGMNHAWFNEADEAIAAFEIKGILQLRHEADVLLKAETGETKSLPLLVFFAWYLMVLSYMGG
jgi:hypothetical protein